MVVNVTTLVSEQSPLSHETGAATKDGRDVATTVAGACSPESELSTGAVNKDGGDIATTAAGAYSP